MRILTFITFFLFSFLASAQNYVQKQELPSINLLVNPGFENAKANWSATVSSTASIVSGTSAIQDQASLVFTPLASGSVTSSAVLLPKGLLNSTGSRCESQLRYFTNSSVYSHRVLNQSGTVISSRSLAPTSSTLTSSLFFVCSVSSTTSVRQQIFASGSASGTTGLTFDSNHLGSERVVKDDIVGGLGYEPVAVVSSTFPVTVTGGASNPVVGLAYVPVSSVSAVSPISITGTASNPVISLGVVPASLGGTGQSTYTTGDILYASGTSLLKLPIGSAGQVLTVNSGIPAWIVGSSGSGGGFAYGFRDSVNLNSTLLTATSSAGAPVSGTFYSSIKNRKPIQDPARNLAVQFGLISRITIQSVYLARDEQGPNGETVWKLSPLVDPYDQVRLVGSGWTNIIGSANGEGVATGTTDDYIEFTFYGNVANILTLSDSTDNMTVASNGGSAGANIFVAASNYLQSLGYVNNRITNAFTNTSKALYTLKLNVAASDVLLTGLESGMYDTNLTVNSGFATTNSGTLVTKSLQESIPVSSTFQNTFGTSGTRGGKVLVYLDSDGSTKKDIQYVNVASATLTSTDHTNEEVILSDSYRKYGAGQGIDFSLLNTSSRQAWFTQSDGGSILRSDNALTNTNGLVANSTGLPNFIDYHFYGSGIDIFRFDTATGTLDTHQVIIDGVNVGSLSATASAASRMTPIASGLKMGWHVLRINRTTSGNQAAAIREFIVYGPKTPPLPIGKIQLASYFVNGSFQPGSVGVNTISQGVVRHASNLRHLTYVGTWALTTSDDAVAGNFSSTATNGNYFEAVFFGSGFDYRFLSISTAANSVLVQLQNIGASGTLQNLTAANFPTASFGNYGITNNYNSGTAVLNQTSVGTNGGSGFYTTSLPESWYRVRFTNQTSTSMFVDAFDVITSIYSGGDVGNYTIHNSLPELTYLKDLRNPSPLIGTDKYEIGYAESTVSTNTTSTVPIPVSKLSVNIFTSTGKLDISYMIAFGGTVTATAAGFVYVDGISYGTGTVLTTSGTATNVSLIEPGQTVFVTPGYHEVEVYWQTSAGTVTTTNRRMSIKERP